MFSTVRPKSTRSVSALCAIIAVTLGVLLGNSAQAAAPQTVSYHGTRVTTAVPGKPTTIKFRVKNTGDTTYSEVKVIFHIPGGLTTSSVAPADAVIEDDTISWVNVPLVAGQSFYPALTFTLDSGTALKTKKQLWVEVTGTDMEATSTNFSVTAVSSVSTKTASTLTSSDVKAMFESVYGRTPTASELTYWLGRRTDKPQRSVLLGAIAYHKNLNIKH